MMRISWSFSSLAVAAAFALAACGGTAAPSAAPASSAPAAAASKPTAATSASAKPAASASAKPVASAAASVKPAASAGASAAVATGTPYKIGFLISLTGPLASFGVSDKNAIDIEVKKLNAGGGIDGHPVEIVMEDDASDPSKGVVAYKKIVDQKPIAMIGPVFSSVSLAVIPMSMQAKLPQITVAAVEAQVTPVKDKKYIFMTAPSTSVMAPSLLSYMQRSNIKKYAVLHDPGAYGMAGPEALKANASKYGIENVADETYQLSDTDHTSHLTKINSSGAEALVVWGSGSGPQIIAAKNYKSLGMKMPILFSAAAADIDGFVKPAGAAAEGAIMNTNKLQVADYLLPSDPSKKVLDDFIPRYRQAAGIEPNEFAANAYDAFNMLVNAIRMAKSTDGDKIVDALEKTKFDGADGTFEYTPENHVGMTMNALAMVQIKDGKLVPVKPNCDGCFDTTVTRG